MRKPLKSIRRVLLVPLFVLVAGGAEGGLYIVTSTDDSGANTLRSALSQAATGDTINFSAGLSGGTIALSSGTLTVASSITIDASSLTNPITISGNNSSGVFEVNNGVTVVFSSLIIANGNNSGNGGGIDNEDGNVTLTNCTLATNSAGAGGGVYTSGTMTMNQCSLLGNTANFGGGVWESAGTVTLNECTVAYNAAQGTEGGGVYTSGGAVTINQCTVTDNSAQTRGGGFETSGGTITVANSIVAGNSATTTPSSGDIYGGASFGGSNIVQRFSQGPYNGNPVNIAPDLSPLANYGGPTQTMPPAVGSPAIDMGNNAAAGAFADDQRGFPRISGAQVDIGAVEIQQATATTLAATDITTNSAVLNGTVTANALSTTVTFEYGLASGVYPHMSPPMTVNPGSTPMTEDSSLPGLTPGTTYHYQIVANDGVSSKMGGDVAFSTMGPPGLTGTIAVPFATTAILSATINPFGAATQYYFECSSGGSNFYSATNTVAAGFGPVNVSVPISGLTPETSYTFELVATNSVGASIASIGGGSPLNFTTGQVLVVTSGGDSGPNTLRGTLVGALADSDDTITFANTLSGATILLESALTLTANVTIDASGLSNGLTINGNNATEIFQVTSGATVVLNSLIITNGKYTGNGAGIDDESGTVTLNQCTVTGCEGSGVGGGIYNSGVGTMTVNQSTLSGNSTQSTPGGGILNGGTMTLNECTLSGNSGNSGGGIFNTGTMTVNQCTVSGNLGGGIDNDATLVVSNSIVSGNDTYDMDGGAMLGGSNIVQASINGTLSGPTPINANPDLAPLGNYGGPTQTMPPLGGSPAIDRGSDSATNMFATDQRGFPRLVGAHVDIGAVEVQFNTAATSLVVTTNSDILSDVTNNGLSLRSAISYGAANATISFASSMSGETITLGSVLTVAGNLTIDASGLSNGITISGNNNPIGIFEVNSGATVVLNSLIIAEANNLGTGGGIDNEGGNVTLNRCMVTGCESFNNGGGIYNNGVGTMTLNECTLVGNFAGVGGGILNDGTMTLNECTLAGNSGIIGGGIYNNGTMTVNQCTVFGNPESGAINQGTLVVSNSIVAGNSPYDIQGGATLGGSNIVQTTAGGALTGPGSVINANPDLAPLGNYGGPTQTMPPLGGSPAIDMGSDSATNQFATDQRGFPRLVGAHVDIGAAEVQFNTTATSIAVTTTNDFLSDVTSNGLSLRSAISFGAANATIRFAPSLSGGTIPLTLPLIVAGNLTIDASGLSNRITISGNNNPIGIFEVNSGATVVMNSLIIADGNAGTGGGIDNEGGAVTLNRCTVAGCESFYDGGGIYNDGTMTVNQCTVLGDIAQNGDGGGIYNDGTMMLNECTLSGNGSDGGGAIFNDGGTTTINQCTLSGNSGAIFNNDGTLNVSNSIVAENSSFDIIGGATLGGSNIVESSSGTFTGPTPIDANPDLAPLGNYGGPTQTMPPLGGSLAIDMGSDSATNQFATDQRGFPRLAGSRVDIGAVEVQFNTTATSIAVTTTNDFLSDVTSNGLSLRSAISFGAANATIRFAPSLSGGTIPLTLPLIVTGNLTIDASGLSNGLTINGNNATEIFQVTSGATVVLNSLVITNGNNNGNGAGIDNEGGTVTLNKCTVTGCEDFNNGGGIYNNGAGTMTVNQSTLSGNYAESGDGGGGIFNNGTTTLNECTFSGNSGVSGGGIFNNGTITVNQCTVSGNSGGGIFNEDTLVASNSIVAGNINYDIFGDATLGGSNIVQVRVNASFIGSIPIDANPDLAPLGNYGGPTQTMPPLGGSPAIDMGSDSATNEFATDQRGLPRLSGTHVDIGAVEVQIPASNPTNPPVVSTPVLTITSPTAGQVLSNFNITASGTATNLGGVSNVFVMDNSGAFVPATTTDGWTNWTASLTPSPLANTLSAYAVGSNGTPSLTNSVSFRFALTNFTTVTNHNKTDDVLTILINDPGPAKTPNRVTSLKNGALVAVSNKVTLTAVPGKNWIFSNWVYGTQAPYAETNSLALKFVMESNFIAEANFVTNVFLPMQGSYFGLFAPGDGRRAQANSGAINFSLTHTGSFSGKVTLGSESASLSGNFSAGGLAIVPVKLKGLPATAATLQLDFVNQWATGTVSNADFDSSLLAYLNVFNAAEKATNFAGQYTFIIPGTTNESVGPLGTSYGTVKISALGAITYGGALADGTSFTGSSGISREGLWPLYLALDKGNGSFWSWNYFDTNGVVSSNQVPVGNAAPSWINGGNPARGALYAGGFTNTNAVIYGSLYSAGTLAGLEGDPVIIAGGNLTAAQTNTLATSGGVEGSNIVLTINKNTGAVSGSFLEGAKKIKVNGVLLQGQSNVAGFFLGTGKSGFFESAP